MDVSIIVPVYNAARYLDRCLASVIGALHRLHGTGEIILVDNGSSDGSLKIINCYKKQYPEYIRVFSCTTPSAGAARNFGVHQAKGRYIWFVDADDELAVDAVDKLFSKAQSTHADLVMLGVARILPDGQRNYLSAVCPGEPSYKSRFVRYGLGPWQVLIRRSWWNRHSFRFAEGVIHEDMELMSVLILYTDKFACIDEPLYFYYQNKNSVLHQAAFSPHIFDIFPALEGLYDRFQTAGALAKYQSELEWFFIWNLLIDSAKDFSRFPEGQPGFSRSRAMLKRYFPHWRRNRFLRQKPIKLRLRVCLNYLKSR